MIAATCPPEPETAAGIRFKYRDALVNFSVVESFEASDRGLDLVVVDGDVFLGERYLVLDRILRSIASLVAVLPGPKDLIDLGGNAFPKTSLKGLVSTCWDKPEARSILACQIKPETLLLENASQVNPKTIGFLSSDGTGEPPPGAR